MALSKKDYIKTAEIIDELRHGHHMLDPLTLDDVTNAFADWFERENPAFDRERFLRAAGDSRVKG